MRDMDNDDDADEAENSLVIEEPPLHIDESYHDEDNTAEVRIRVSQQPQNLFYLSWNQCFYGVFSIQFIVF